MARGSDSDEPEEREEFARASLGDLFPQLVEEVRTLVAAEVRLYRAEALRGSVSAGIALGLIIGALTLAQAALIAMLVGLVFVLTPHIGAGWATTAVTLGGVAVSALLGWLGWRRINCILDPDRKS